MRMKKNIPNAVTALRILGSIPLLFIAPLSAPFFILYALCGASDLLDGMLARRLGAVSQWGQKLDSAADLLFFGVVLVRLLPILDLPSWALWWIAAITALRLLSLGAGFLRCRRPVLLHTYANKAAGLLLFCFPVLYAAFGLNGAVLLPCAAATLSSLEELLLNLTAPEPDRDVKSLLCVQRPRQTGR